MLGVVIRFLHYCHFHCVHYYHCVSYVDVYWVFAAVWLLVLVPSFLQATGTTPCPQTCTDSPCEENESRLPITHYSHWWTCTHHMLYVMLFLGTAIGEIPPYWMTRAAREAAIEAGDRSEVKRPQLCIPTMQYSCT